MNKQIQANFPFQTNKSSLQSCQYLVKIRHQDFQLRRSREN